MVATILSIARTSGGRRIATRSIPGGLHGLHRNNSLRSFAAAATVHPPVSSSATAPERYDVVIVGGGIAGSALACALASSKIASTQKIALIEASDMSSHIDKWHPVPHEYSNRVSSLAPRSVHFLKRIGVWDELDPSRVGPCEAMQVWDGVSGSRIVFDAADSTNALHPKVMSFLQEHVFGGSGSGAAHSADQHQRSSSSSSTDNEQGGSSNSNSNNKPVLAWMTENLHVQYGLRKQMLAHQARGVPLDVFDKTKVLGISTSAASDSATGSTTTTAAATADLSDWPVIELDNGKSIQARLLIGADGVNSPVRSFAKIESLGWDYGQFGLVATLKIDPSTCSMRRQGEGIAWQRFLPTGPIALLPLNDGLASLVWSTTPKLAQELKKLPPQAFCALVNAGLTATPAELNYLYKNIGTDGQPLVDFEKEIEWRASVAEKEAQAVDPKKAAETPRPPKVVDVQANTRAPFPLRFRNSNSYVEDRVALVGDAAHTVHPLAGQGLNQGLADVECLARVIEQSLRSGSDIGNIHSLTPYSSERFLPNLAMLGTVDKLQKLYSTDFAPVVWARSWGLSAVDQLGPLKTELMRFAMGVEEASDRP